MSREREERYDSDTFPVFWELASNHPESGIEKMTCIEYHDVPIEQSGILRDGQTQVWFRDVVHDVFPTRALQ